MIIKEARIRLSRIDCERVSNIQVFRKNYLIIFRNLITRQVQVLIFVCLQLHTIFVLFLNENALQTLFFIYKGSLDRRIAWNPYRGS